MTAALSSTTLFVAGLPSAVLLLRASFHALFYVNDLDEISLRWLISARQRDRTSLSLSYIKTYLGSRHDGMHVHKAMIQHISAETPLRSSNEHDYLPPEFGIFCKCNSNLQTILFAFARAHVTPCSPRRCWDERASFYRDALARQSRRDQTAKWTLRRGGAAGRCPLTRDKLRADRSTWQLRFRCERPRACCGRGRTRRWEVTL